MKILLIGPQGSGKSTQGKLLSEYLNIPFIVTGDILREIAAKDTSEGREIKKILDSGQLVSDEITKELIKKRLEQPDTQKGYILDGYPRTAEQAELLNTAELRPDKIIYINIPEEILIERLMKRGREDDTPEIIRTRLNVFQGRLASLMEALKGIELIVIEGSGTIEEIQQEIREKLS